MGEAAVLLWIMFLMSVIIGIVINGLQTIYIVYSVRKARVETAAFVITAFTEFVDSDESKDMVASLMARILADPGVDEKALNFMGNIVGLVGQRIKDGINGYVGGKMNGLSRAADAARGELDPLYKIRCAMEKNEKTAPFADLIDLIGSEAIAGQGQLPAAVMQQRAEGALTVETY